MASAYFLLCIGNVAVVTFQPYNFVHQGKPPKRTFHLISPLLAPSDRKCLFFAAFLHSTSLGSSLFLRLQHRVGNNYIDLITISASSESDAWSTSVAPFHSSSAFSFVFSASAHSVVSGIVSIDNVTTVPLCRQG